MEKIKLSEQELQQIETLRQTFTQSVNTLGLIHYQILELQSRKDKVENELLDITKQEQVLYNELVARYGEGSLSLETGEFVKN
jgi:hypothetical protein